MTSNSSTVELISPLGRRAWREPIAAAPRPSTLNGRTVHLVLSLPHGSGMEPLIEAVGTGLKRHFPDVTLVLVVRKDRYMSDDPEQRAEIERTSQPCVIYFGSGTGALNQVAARYCAELERAGVPTLLIVPTAFTAAVAHMSDTLRCPLVYLGAPATPNAAFSELVCAELLTQPRALRPVAERPDVLRINSADAEQLADNEGWGDGLPLQLPLASAVESMLLATTHARDEVVSARLGPDLLTATVAQVAANAVMAGAQPKHMPLLLAATQALGSNDAIHPMLSSVNGFCFPFVVNGPVRVSAGLDAGLGTLGAKSHRAVQRALRLILQNLAGLKPGQNAFAIQGQPMDPAFLIVENEAASPWASFAQDRGAEPNQSRLTLFGGGWSHVGTYFYAEDGADALGAALARLEMPHSAVVLMSPARARQFAALGHSKAAVAEQIRASTMIDMRTFRRSGYFAGRIRDRIVNEGTWPRVYLDAPGTTALPAYPPGGIHIVVTGGDGAPVMSAWKMELLATASPDAWC